MKYQGPREPFAADALWAIVMAGCAICYLIASCYMAGVFR